MRKGKNTFFFLLFEWGHSFLLAVRCAFAYGPSACSAATWGGWLAACPPLPQSDKGHPGAEAAGGAPRFRCSPPPNAAPPRRRAPRSVPWWVRLAGDHLAGGVTSPPLKFGSTSWVAGRQASLWGCCWPQLAVVLGLFKPGKINRSVPKINTTIEFEPVNLAKV